MQITFEYKLTETDEEPFLIPEGSTRTRNDIFDQAQGFGIEIMMPWNTWITGHVASIMEGTVENRKNADEEGLLIIPLGFKLRVADGVAFYHESLVESGLDFIVDQSVKVWYKVNLYLKTDSESRIFVKKGAPVLKIMPIPDSDYNFSYRRIFG